MSTSMTIVGIGKDVKSNVVSGNMLCIRNWNSMDSVHLALTLDQLHELGQAVIEAQRQIILENEEEQT